MKKEKYLVIVKNKINNSLIGIEHFKNIADAKDYCVFINKETQNYNLDIIKL